ncbi:MAG: hypothetical protein WBN22_01135 [Verrucomicrobiia bacterium]
MSGRRKFLNPDPSGFAGGLNFYAAFNGNPISYRDPTGLGAVGDYTGLSWLPGFSATPVDLTNPFNLPSSENVVGIWSVPAPETSQDILSQVTPPNPSLDFTPGVYQPSEPSVLSLLGLGATVVGGELLDALAPATETTTVTASEELEAALLQREAALNTLNTTEKGLAEAEGNLENAMQAVNTTGQQAGWNSVQYQQLQQAVQSAQRVVDYRRLAVINARVNWQAANEAVMNIP